VDKIISGRYKVYNSIGRGGMAEIYRAFDTKNKIDVAIKILSKDKALDIISQKRFKSEVDLMLKVNSPYVIDIYDYKYEKDEKYIVMEYIEGLTLRSYIKQKTKLNINEVVEFAKEIAYGIKALHNVKIVHRDLKSQNVLVSKDGRLKIIDLGISRDDFSADLTSEDNVIGSVHYIAPELISGEKATKQADIYSLGILIFEMLVGEVPFNSTNPIEIAKSHRRENLPSIQSERTDVPYSIQNIITMATFKKKEQRYKTIESLIKDLENCLSKDKIHDEELIIKNNEIVKNKSFLLSNKFMLTLLSISLVLIILLTTLLVVLI